MCVGIPMKLTAIDGSIGTVEEEGVSREVGLDLLEDPQVGNYVLVHAGYAIEQIDPKEAKETLDLLRQMHIIGHERSEENLGPWEDLREKASGEPDEVG